MRHVIPPILNWTFFVLAALVPFMERMTKDFKFKDFNEAMVFVNGVAKIANARDHHPDILIKYNEVSLTFYTHTENAVTDKDIRLAAEIEELIPHQKKDLA